MRLRWIFLTFAAIACALLGAALWLFLQAPPPPPINVEVYERIEKGMTQAEVEAAIGLPPGDYRTDPAGRRHFAELLPGKGARVVEWEADGCNIQVRVDERSGRVTSKIFGEGLRPPTLLERLRAWAGW
jgi:hypothetical protein